MFQDIMTFDIATKSDLSQQIINSQIAELREFDTIALRDNTNKLLDFYEGRMLRPEYLKNFGFQDMKMPLMGLRLTKKIIDKISLLYKTAPKREFTKDNDGYTDFLASNTGRMFNLSMKTAERYKNLLEAVLYMPLFTNNGFRPYIFTEWIPWFSKSDSLYPVAYSIPLSTDKLEKGSDKVKEEVWLFVSEEDWFLHDANGGNKRADPSFKGASDMKHHLGIMPIAELRIELPVTGYWPEGQIELASANQSINMAANDIFGLMHYNLFPEIAMSGISPAEAGLQRNAQTGLYFGTIGTGFNKRHIASSPDFHMEAISHNLALDQAVNTIEKLTQMVGQTYNVNLKFEMSGSPASGFALLVENIDLLEAREDSIDTATIAEQHIYNILEAQSSKFSEIEFKLAPLSKDNVLTVDYREGIDFPVNQKEEIERWQFEFEWNASSILDYMRSNDPELDDEALLKKLADNRAVNEKLTAAGINFRDVLEGLNEPEEPPVIPEEE